MKDTQNKRLLAYLEKEESIDPLQAWEKLGIYRLSARIFDLRETKQITTTKKEVSNMFGETIKVAEYSLINQ